MEAEGFREAFETAIKDEVDGVGGGVILGAVVFGHGCFLVGFDTSKDVPVPGTATSWERTEQPRALLQKRWCTSNETHAHLGKHKPTTIKRSIPHRYFE